VATQKLRAATEKLEASRSPRRRQPAKLRPERAIRRRPDVSGRRRQGDTRRYGRLEPRPVAARSQPDMAAPPLYPLGGTPRRPGGRTRPGHRAHRSGLSHGGQRRAFSMLLLITVAFLCIGFKLADIQGINSSHYLAAGGSEWEQTVTLPAERGSILDRNGDELAMSIPQATIYADPYQVADPHTESRKLAPILHIHAEKLENLLTENGGFVYVARTVDDATAAKVARLNLPGIYSLQEPKAFYPGGQLAMPLLGQVGTDGIGLAGLEYQYNPTLAGKAGKEVDEIDPSGRQIPGGVQSYQAPVTGQDVVLTIDEPLQYDAEQALAQAVVAAHAKGGIALLMDTKTGEILADAQLTMPTPGSTVPPAVPVDVARAAGAPNGGQPVEAPNAASLTNVYEPGSVNKLITISAALQTGLVKPSDMFYIPDSYRVSDGVFHDAESHPTEHWSVTDILANSSNIGTIQIAQRLGKDNLLNYIKDFGLGSATDLNFPGESEGILPSYWSGTSIATVAFGQGVSVTAMQMLAAYNTIANGGVYVAPKLVDETIDAHGKAHPAPSSPAHRVVSPTVAAQMTTMLDEVVRVGTGRAANLDPYTVAGKTGTALVPSPTGGYEGGHYVASFGGFVPAEDPQITAMVVVDDTPYYGAAASAPTFARITRDALQELNVPPLPKQPPAPGVPLSTNQAATGADPAGISLPGILSSPTVIAPTTATATTTPATTTPFTPTTTKPGGTQTPPTTTPTASPTTTLPVGSRSSPPGWFG
jgi:cell division protein FtsI (penicillin-binding protein 3)